MHVNGGCLKGERGGSRGGAMVGGTRVHASVDPQESRGGFKGRSRV